MDTFALGTVFGVVNEPISHDALALRFRGFDLLGVYGLDHATTAGEGITIEPRGGGSCEPRVPQHQTARRL